MPVQRARHIWKEVSQSKTFEILRAFWAWQPLTFRGILAAILGTLALRLFALPEYDLVADIIGTAVLSLLCLAVLSAVLFRILVAARLSAEIHFENVEASSRTPVASAILLRSSSVPPFFALRLQRKFRKEGVSSPVHIVRGKISEDGIRYLTDELVFPHRGYWELQALDCRIEDLLGFTKLAWRIPLATGIEVGTKDIPIEPLPIVASSARAGDELSLSRERSGDLFDIKAYDPSDGVKRILWKTYAKSGQVVVRRPEPAVIPEGELALYLVAGTNHDYVAGALQSYLKQLAQNQIIVLFSTDGVHESGIDLPDGFLKLESDILHAINRCVWSKTAGTGEDFATFLGSLESSGRFTNHLIIFGPEEGDWMKRTAAQASYAGVKIHAAVVPTEVNPEEALRKLDPTRVSHSSLEGFPPVIRKALSQLLKRLKRKPKTPKFPSYAGEALNAGVDLFVVKGRGGFG